MFAFEWKDPDSGVSGQLTWTRLPKGFKNLPTLFDEALHRDLTSFHTTNQEVILLQYVDDLLLAAEIEQECLMGTQVLLTKLSELGYRVTAKKQVVYLGYLLKDGQRWLTDNQKQVVAQIPLPTGARGF